jgi:hypothetical protein
MGFCSDASTQYLRDVGYNVVRLPRDFLPPLSLIGRQNKTFEFVGSVQDLITNPPGPLPQITTGQQAASINGQRSSSMKVSLGLTILNGLISGLGGGKIGASASFTNARKMTFEFNNVTFDSVVPTQIGRWLRDGDVDQGNPLLAQYVLGNGSLYVVTERLRTAELTTSFEASDGVNASVDVPVLSNQVGGSLGVELANGRTNAIKFKGPGEVTFGFKCFQIGVKNGEITMLSVKPGSVLASLADDAEEGEILADGLMDVEVPSPA